MQLRLKLNLIKKTINKDEAEKILKETQKQDNNHDHDHSMKQKK